VAGNIVKVLIRKAELVCHLLISGSLNELRPKVPPTLIDLLAQPLYTFWTAAKLHHDFIQMSEELDCMLRKFISPETHFLANVV